MINKVEKNAGRIVFLDYIRVFACLSVMIVHASEYFYCISGTETMVANFCGTPFCLAFLD